MGQGSKEKEAKQEYRFKGSCTEGDFGPIPCGASGGTSELSQSGAKRAGVLMPLHRQSLGDINFQALPVLVAIGRVVLTAWGSPPTERGCEGPGVVKGRGNVEGSRGGHAGYRGCKSGE